MPHFAVSAPEPFRRANATETLIAWSARYPRCHIDLGTGDGQYARALARRFPMQAVIGLDTCLDHLKGSARRQPPNVRQITADALTYADGLLPVAQSISINFPYGSLLTALIAGDPDLLQRLDRSLASDGEVVIRVNASAIEAVGFETLSARGLIEDALRTLPGMHLTTRTLSQGDLRRFPSSWAKRLGYGRATEAFSFVLRRS